MDVRVATVARSLAVAVAKFDMASTFSCFVELGCVFFLQEICRVKFSAGGGALGFSPFVVCSGEESFKGSPSFQLNKQTFTGFAVVYKKAVLIYK